MDKDSKFTRDDEGYVAVRVVTATEALPASDKDSMFGRDTEGNIAVRVVGAGGGGSVDYNRVIEKSANIPQATESNVGKVYMYSGETNSTYTHGYIYENKATTEYSATVEFNPASISGTTVSCSGDDFMSLLEEFGSGNISDIIKGTLTYDESGELLVFVGQDDTDTQVCTFQLYTQDYEDAGFTFTGTLADGDVITFSTSITESESYAWTRIDVQPAGSGGAVDSVNGQTGDVVLDAEDVGALPDTTKAIDIQGVPQYTTMPTASASNLGEVAQYAGVETPDVPASATITQTVGSGLTDLSVDVATFESAEQPTGDETAIFTVASIIPASYLENQEYPSTYCDVSIDATIYRAWCEQRGFNYENVVIQNVYMNEDGHWSIGDAFDDLFWQDVTLEALVDAGITITNVDTSGNTATAFAYQPASAVWEKDSETVDLANYGITFTGTPATDDTLEVDYSAFVKGWTNGYFYKSEATYTAPVATISQTAGSGLTDLSVDVELFEAEEQPTGDTTVEFESVVASVSGQFGESGGVTMTLDNPAQFVTTAEQNWGADWQQYMLQSGYYYYDGANWTMCRASGGSDIFSVVPPSGWGITVVGTPVGGDDIPFTFDFGGQKWYKNSEQVDLSAYGISYTGTPADNDELTVVYTAPTLSGYVWNQKNVQPASETPSAGIDWKTKIDLPADFWSTDWAIYPIFRIAGGLPDGEYEMYFQAKKSDGSSRVFGLATYVLRFGIDNTNRQFYGWFEPVIDGNWGGTNDKIYSDGNYIYSVFWEDNGDFVIWNNGEVFQTNIHGYYANTAVPECFKLSAIKNVETGQEYIATGSLYNNDSFQNVFSGSLRCNPIQQSPDVPTYYGRYQMDVSGANAFSISGIAYRDNHFDYVSEVAISLSLGDDVFNATFKTFADSYELTVEDATGVFENTQIGRMPSYWDNLFVKFNFPAGTTGTILCSVGWKGGDRTNHYISGSNVDNTFVTLNVLKIGVTPASVNYLGKIMQYTGTTDANYTNGYFYKATGTVVTTPQSLIANNIDPNDVSVTIDVDNLIPALQAQTGWDVVTIKSYLSGDTNWQMYYDWDNVTVTSLYWNVYGLFTDSSVLNCFTVSTTGSYSGESTISFFATYTPETQTVSGGAWTRVDVQPSGLQNTATGSDSISIAEQSGSSGVLSGNVSTAINCKVTGTVNSAGFVAVNGALGPGAFNFVPGNHSVSIKGSAKGSYSVAIGSGGTATGSYSTVINGLNVTNSGDYAISIGLNCMASATNSIQIGHASSVAVGTNNDADTFKVANSNGNFEMMNANGNLPAERLASITGLADGNYRPRLTISSGVATITWVAE